ncbi:EAL domain-containing protein [Oleiphilus messinensis]|uniref:EAL domain-containing protein n=1 Tax=Oleiphilus messinensis TaxID=141451 RepID=UPI0018E0371B|nr:EAL domain-containing protein [Oleiphilus messinensis]
MFSLLSGWFHRPSGGTDLRWRLRGLQLILLCLVLPGTLTANTISGEGELPFRPQLDVLVDSSNQLDIKNLLDETIQQNWQFSGNSIPNFGYTHDAYWFRFTLKNFQTREQRLIIEIAYPLLDEIDVFLISGENAIQHYQTGDTRPFEQRPIDHPHFLIPEVLDPQENLTVMLRVRTSGTLQVPIKVWQEDRFYQANNSVEQIHALYYGTMIVIIIFNIFVFLALKEATYIYYALSTLGYLAILGSLRGKMYQVLWPESPLLHEYIMLLSVPFTMLFSTLFARAFLSLKQTQSVFYPLTSIVIALSLFGLIGTLLLPYQYSIQLSVFIAIPGCFILLIVGPIQWFKGNKAARFYSMAWALLSLGGVITAMNKAGLLNTNLITEYSLQIGSALEAILLSMALAERIYREREQKLRAQADTIREHRERRNAEMSLIHKALTHSVTGLPNSAHFQMFINNLATNESPTSFAVVLIQFVNFHEIIKTLGHSESENLLAQLGRKINSQAALVPEIAKLEDRPDFQPRVCTFENATFGMVVNLQEIPKDNRATQDFIQYISTPVEFRGMLLDFRPHIGTAGFPKDGNDADTLIRHGFVALEYAYQYDDQLAHYTANKDPYNTKRLTLIAELSRALQDNLLTLVFHPKIDLKQGRVTGVEALLRWHHPRFGQVPPDEFIAVAEQTGIIKPLTQWVLNRSLEARHHLATRGFDLSVSINISTNNLRESDFTEEIYKTLERTNTPPEKVTLELTETSMMHDPVKALNALEKLHQIGVRVSIDDFGTGYSSLSYIKRVPAQEIKIDKSLILDLDRISDDEVIVRTTVNMCHSLGFSVVAEGVECLAVEATLKQMGCDQVQGFHFTQPLPLEALIQWLENYSATQHSFVFDSTTQQPSTDSDH